MKTLRSFLGFPFRLLANIALCFAMLCRWMGRRLLRWIAAGTIDHVVWPLAVIGRYVAGKPNWQPKDLVLGRQPRTEADRKIADDHPDVVRAICGCNDPSCALKKAPHYSYVPGGHTAQEKAQDAAFEDATASIDQLPAPMRDEVIVAMRRIDGYDALKEEHDRLRELVELTRQQLMTLERIVEQDKLLIESDRKVIDSDDRVINHQRGVIADLEALVAELEAQLAARDERIADLDEKFSDLETRLREFRAAHAPLN